jgi:hypothetical protein
VPALDFTRKTGVLFAILDHDGTRLDRSLRLPMKSNEYITDLGKHKLLSFYGKPTLRVGKGVVLTFRLESRKSRFLAVFDATEKGLIRFIQPFYNMLKDLGMDVFEFRYVPFPLWQRCFLLVVC